ncbi:hypothetical protein ACWGJ9_09555 [Curtobacterium citreum]
MDEWTTAKDAVIDRVDAGLGIGKSLVERLESLRDDNGLDVEPALEVAKGLADASKGLQDSIKWDAIKQTLNLPKHTVDLARALRAGQLGFHNRFNAVSAAASGVTGSLAGVAGLAALAAPIFLPSAAVAISSASLVLLGVGAAIQVARIAENRRHAAGVSQFLDGGSSEHGPGQTLAGVAGAILRGSSARAGSGNTVSALKAALEQLAGDLGKRAEELSSFHRNTLRKFQSELEAQLGGSTRPEAREAMQRLRDADERGTRGTAALKGAAAAALKLARVL